MHWIERATKLANASRAAGPVPGEVGAGSGRGVLAKQKDSHGQLYIYDFIGESFMWGSGVTDKSVVAELGKLKGVSVLDIFINSEGGSVVDGKGIYASLKRFEAKKIVHIDGLAASAASFIAMVGDEIRIAENATLMMHEAFGVYAGTAADFEAARQELDRENALIAGMYAARAKRPAAEFWQRDEKSGNRSGLMADETWFTADQAVALKLADAIERNASPANAQADAALVAKIPALRIAQETQRRISMARARLVDADHSVLQDRRRASPVANSLRPAARPPHA